MPFCPECNTEYLPGNTVCHDCQVPLVANLPSDDEIDREQCAECGADVSSDADYCPTCGSLLIIENRFCKNHPAELATSVCIICECLLCDMCARVAKAKRFCEDHSRIEVSEGWALVFSSMDYFEANIIRAKLESNGLTVAPRNNTGIGFIAEGVIDSVIGRTILRYPVKIFVPVTECDEALAIIKDQTPLDSDNFIPEQ